MRSPSEGLQKEQEKERQEKEEEHLPPISDEYFDIKSTHSLIPLLPYNNSYNRNMALTFSHSGVKYILDRLLHKQDEHSEVLKMREKLL